MTDLILAETMEESVEIHAEQVKLARVKQALLNSSGNMVGVLGGAWFVSFAIYQYTNILYLVIWNIILHTLVGLIYVFMKRHPIHKIEPQEVGQIALVRMSLGALIGLTWGLIPFLPITHEPLLYRTFLFVAISALGAVGSIGFSVFLPYVFVLISCSFGPAILWFFMDGSTFSILMGISGLVWVALTLKTSYQVGRTQVVEIEMREKLKEQTHQLELANKQIAELANHDTLTGLANRRLFETTFKYYLATAKRNKNLFGLLMVDLDGFKAINDQMGHHTGDILLQKVAGRLSNSLREVDCTARIGGDEFAILVDQISGEDDLKITALKVADSLKRSFTIENKTIRIGASIGLAMWPHHGETFERLLHSADQAMYKAKQQKIDICQYSKMSEYGSAK